MPINKKMSLVTILKELMAGYKKEGKIGNIKPKSKKHALSIALAIAHKAKK